MCIANIIAEVFIIIIKFYYCYVTCMSRMQFESLTFHSVICEQICQNHIHAMTKFSLPTDSFINKLTKHHCATTTNKQICFYWGISRYTPVLRCP